MKDKKKIVLIVSTIALAIGGYILTKYLTRNTVKYKYITVKYVDYPTSEVTTTEGDE